ncbi:MAG: glycosyltransferase family 2 protein [Bacillota bacterium]|nr:glycosyltransferase family 2 protein [Bacillota bacterium]
MADTVTYSVVVPLYNEELVITESYKRIKKVMEHTDENYEIIFINDGSKDKTEHLARFICQNDPRIKLINFSRNFGHQAAITAGMNNTRGEAVIVIDADLQDPPEVMLEMIKKWKEGYQVVYAKRTEREGETWLKKFTAKVFYRVLKSITAADIPVDTGDFRLLDRKVCDALNSLPERNRYVRGLVSWLGFKQTYVEFVRKERFAGETKYTFKKMMKLAMDGITSFSYKPLILIGYLGGLLFSAGFISIVVLIIKDIIKGTNILSLGFILAVINMLFGILFEALAVMGQYIGRILDESKGRPMYVIDNTTCYKENKAYEDGRKSS